jgi:hypothetical protein
MNKEAQDQYGTPILKADVGRGRIEDNPERIFNPANWNASNQ